jgi:hypothetical protein
VGVEQLPVLSIRRKDRVHGGCGTEVKDQESQNPHPLPTPQRVRHPQKISVHGSGVEGFATRPLKGRR